MEKEEIDSIQRQIDVLRDDFQNLESMFHATLKALEDTLETIYAHITTQANSDGEAKG